MPLVDRQLFSISRATCSIDTQALKLLQSQQLNRATNINDNDEQSTLGYTPTSTNTPTHTRVLSTQAPGQPTVIFNKQSTLTNRYSSIKKTSFTTIVSTTNMNNNNKYALDNTLTPSNMLTYIRVLSTQAPG